MPTKVKTSYVSFYSPTLIYNSGNGVVTTLAPTFHRHPNYQGTIIYDGGPKTIGTKKCKHVVVRRQFELGALGWGLTHRFPTYNLYGSAFWDGDMATPPDPMFDTNISSANALRDMLDGALSDRVLAPLFIKELPKMRSTYDTMVKRKFGKKTFPNRFLAYKFGILPFIGDLNALVYGEDRIRSHMQFINAVYNTTYTDEVSSGTLSSGQSWNTGKQVTKARMKVVRRYTAHDDIMMHLDYYGATILPNVWEAIPYSFIVDWFFDVGGLIDAVSPKFQVPAVQVLDVGTHQHAEYQEEILTPDHRRGKYVRTGTKTVKFYKRFPSVPAVNSILAGGGFSFARSATGLALLLQKTL